MLQMNRRRAIAVLGLPLLLAGCFGNRASFRYKLTLSVETPEGVKSGFSVVELDAGDVTIPGRGTMSRATGEAVYVDLGEGARPIVAVMVPYRPERGGFKWGDGKPDIDGLLRLYGEPAKSEETLIDRIRRLARLRGPRMLTADDLPDLVTFADINDPKSVRWVDPHDLPAALGRDVKWNSITIEVTNEPVTTGIEKKLPWLKGLGTTLNGKTLHPIENVPAAGHLVASNFKKGA
jgi:hypothetical protein